MSLQAVEKLVLSKLLVENSNRRIYNVDRHAGAVRHNLPVDVFETTSSTAIHALEELCICCACSVMSFCRCLALNQHSGMSSGFETHSGYRRVWLSS